MLHFTRETHPEDRDLESLAFRRGECALGIGRLGDPSDLTALRQGAAHTLAQDFVRLDQQYAEIHGDAPLRSLLGRVPRDSNQLNFVSSQLFLPSVSSTDRLPVFMLTSGEFS